MREIRFRFWSKLHKVFVFPTWIDMDACRHDQIEIMQFTGKLDIHNKEIYEGDIVRGTCSTNPVYVCQGLKDANMLGKEVVGLVEYSNFYAQFYVSTDGITYLSIETGINDIEVVGNQKEKS